jgi:branched-chain amino acid transport system permease protein
MRISDRQSEPGASEALEPSTERTWLTKISALKRAGTWIKWGLLLLVLVLALLGPTYLGLYGLTLGFLLFNNITQAQSWNLVGGYGGQFSLVHSLMMSHRLTHARKGYNNKWLIQLCLAHLSNDVKILA